MMQSKNYILTQINYLVSLFPFIKIRYEHIASEKEHFLEVLPAVYYNSNKGYIDREIEITKNFEDTFPDEAICFVTEGSLYSIKHVTFEAQGLLYGVDYSFVQSHYSNDVLIFSNEKVANNQQVRMVEVIPVSEPNKLHIKFAPMVEGTGIVSKSKSWGYTYKNDYEIDLQVALKSNLYFERVEDTLMGSTNNVMAA
ncbi:hypothetical protein [Emticicia sp. 17c]|uniref:hypothetical protein n=1 Tax=Emticicia sp. 17c TaxID=3127704 RepID=UPI00301D2A54